MTAEAPEVRQSHTARVYGRDRRDAADCSSRSGRRRATAAQNAVGQRSDGEIRKVDGATVKRKVADGSVGNKVVVTDDVNRSESVEGKTFLSRWKRPRESSPRKKDRARATVLAGTRVLNVRGAHRFSDSAQVLVGEHFIENGLKEALLESEDSETLNTSFVERLNLTIRQGSAYLRRRSPCHARCEDQLRAHVELLRCRYNFIRRHRGLKFGSVCRTPAMQAGLVTKRLSFSDVFTARGRSLRRFVAVVRVSVAVSFTESDAAQFPTFSWPTDQTTAA